jgi:hypothetical protein
MGRLLFQEHPRSCTGTVLVVLPVTTPAPVRRCGFRGSLASRLATALTTLLTTALASLLLGTRSAALCARPAALCTRSAALCARSAAFSTRFTAFSTRSAALCARSTMSRLMSPEPARPVPFATGPSRALSLYVAESLMAQSALVPEPALIVPVMIVVPLPPMAVEITVGDVMVADGENHGVLGLDANDDLGHYPDSDADPRCIPDGCLEPGAVIEAEPGIVVKINAIGIRDNVNSLFPARNNRHFRRLGKVQRRRYFGFDGHRRLRCRHDRRGNGNDRRRSDNDRSRYRYHRHGNTDIDIYMGSQSSDWHQYCR